MAPLVLGHEEVGGETERPGERRGDSDGAERDSCPDLHDDGEAGETEHDGNPDPPPNVLLVDEACEQRDEERSRELDQQRHSDRQVVDRDEVEPLHECDAEDPESGEKQELAAADAERGSR